MFPLPIQSSFFEDIYFKKEYNKFKTIPILDCEESTNQELFYDYQNHQKLIKNYINPNTPYKNLIVMWGTGVGKTLGAIAIAENFKEYISIIRSETQSEPFIYIISRNEARNNFYKELMSKFINPPYITEQEREKLNTLELQATNKNAIIRFQDYKKELIKRIKQQGHYKFMGANEFSNAVLGRTVSPDRRKKTIKYIQNNDNGLIIIDEAHNMDSNDLIVAMNALRDRSKNLRIILLTATPMMNKAREIISMLNLINPNSNLTYSQIFEKNNDNDKPTPEGLKLLGIAARGYISYNLGKNPFTFPKQIDMGELYKPFKHTKLIKVPMSKFQFATYKHYILEKRINISNIGGARGILDMVIPSPKNDKFGIFERQDLEELINTAPQDWLKAHEIKPLPKLNTIGGAFLKIPQLKKYSPKFEKIILDIIPTVGPVIVYNDQITGIGLLLFSQILIENGFEEYALTKSPEANKTNYMPSTRCVDCGIPSATHTNSHTFIPAKFIFLYGEISITKRNFIISLINNYENKHGHIIKIILGSSITAESIDFKRIRAVFITNFQDNVSTLNQIIGRAIRHCSHNGLPENERTVAIYKYVATLPAETPGQLSVDEEKYYNNELKHENIISVENVLKANAIDCAINDQPICAWKPKKIDKLDTKTYDIYFFEDEITNIIKTISRLFYTTKIFWTYEEIKKELAPVITEEKYLAIALDRMLSDEIAIINQFNDPGFIIYREPYYLFQPMNNDNYNIPFLSRFIPIRSKHSVQISIKAYTASLVKHDTTKFNLQEIINTINETDNYSKIISAITDHKYLQEIIEYGIINNNKRILTYFKPFLLTRGMLENSNYSSDSLSQDAASMVSKEYLGHIFSQVPRCLTDNNEWIQCHKVIKPIKERTKIVENPHIIGFMDKQGNKLVFKLRPSQFVIQTAKQDRRTIQKGFVCNQSSNKAELIKIAKNLKIDINKLSIKQICSKIEDILRANELKDKGKVKWFYEYIEIL